MVIVAPQHATAPLVRTPQVYFTPAATEVNAPTGGVPWPRSLAPQHTTELSFFTPQAWSRPTDTDV